ncbi:MAG: hypothetical protein AMS24_04950 [Chlamydiae bacterium SM23_39]|nr:MAG: hypothetical protein AMS24_04950 [Chlamydiae bacterium SM23_39]
MKRMRYKIYTFGCKTNQYESQVYKEQLEKMGCIEDNNADIFIINSCSVTKFSERKSILLLKKIRSKYPRSKIFFTGCSFFKVKEDDKVKVVSNLEKEDLIYKIFPNKKFLFKISKFSLHTRAFVKIQDGCNNFCSYCIIPNTRGRSRSRDIEDILLEVKDLLNNGYKEVVLTGINVGEHKELLDLLKKLVKLKKLERIRLSSIDPSDIDKDLLDLFLKEEKICSSIHMVLQSGSDRILKFMNRKYRMKDFLKIVEYLKSRDEDFTFTTDIIVGFPKEGEEDFVKTLKIIEFVKFLKVHLFPFSRRENTKAYFYKEIEKKIVEERKKILLQKTENISFDVREKYLNRKMDVLVEDNFFGYTKNFLPLKILNEKNFRNNIKTVFIKKNCKNNLLGEVYEDKNF